jgi:hypothetical protein
MALVTTLSGENSDSYVSLAEADEYFAAGYHLQSATWDALATDEAKETALRTAARDLNRLRYFGRKAVSTQALEWPRVYRSIWTADTIPEPIKQAQMEQALARSAGACCASADPWGVLSVDCQLLLKGYWTNTGHVFAGDRESAVLTNFSEYADGQREWDEDA